MKILKKIIALAIILWMFGQTNAMDITNTKAVESEAEFKITMKIKDGQKIIDKIDKVIEELNQKKLNTLKEKLIILKKSWKIKYWSDNELIINYIEFKINEKILLKIEQEEKNIFTYKLSEEDNKKVNDELIKIQKNILKKWVSNFEKILGELEKYTNYEEKGNFEFKFNSNHKSFWEAKVEVKLKDYISRNSNFDAQFKSKIEALLESNPKAWEEVKINFSAFFDYIIKDQNYYVLLKDLNITNDKESTEIKLFIEKAKQIASKNKYIKIEDINTQQVINRIKQFTPQNILKQGNEIVEKPLFKAYKKEWNKYYLVPSKYGCDTAKKLSQTFDPFNWNTCTDNQYQSLLKEISDSKSEFYIDLSNKNLTKIWFESSDDSMDELNWYISFSEKYIEEINFIATPNQEEYKWEWASLNYKRNKFLNASLYADKWEINIKLESTLDRNNNFSFIDFNTKIKELTAKLSLKNKIISWNYNFEERSDKLVWIISWKTDYNNSLSEFKISNQIINSWEYSPFENITIFEYKNNLINLNNKFSSEWSMSEFNIWWKYSYNKLTSWNIKLLVKVKDSTFDYDTYKRIYSWDFKEVLNSTITLKNKVINGSTKFNLENQEYLVIEHKGKLEENFFELNNNFNLKEKAREIFIKSFDPMWENSDVEKIDMNLNFQIDTRGNKNNWNIYIDLNIDTDKIIEIELDNKSTKTYKKIDIQAPAESNTIPLEEAMENEKLY